MTDEETMAGSTQAPSIPDVQAVYCYMQSMLRHRALQPPGGPLAAGSDELLLDGDVLIPRTRNAMKCLKEPRACLWPKSANGNVEIPFLISEKYAYLSNFKKEDTNNLNTPYDYSSIMHYGRTAFGMHGSETITPFPNPSVPIGQRDRLSNFDILKINKLYKCWNYLW
ncbi:Low choriolytic enzyme [Collichthys lucidus]|uniref:Metalloendopeptidase n=1 Tax=Collichthys lucidus TaxID=240159 RepID=A0A4U5TXR1_COLLU|nr:Low choriolytic enzyme [Collichthys lucidus]